MYDKMAELLNLYLTGIIFSDVIESFIFFSTFVK